MKGQKKWTLIFNYINRLNRFKTIRLDWFGHTSDFSWYNHHRQTRMNRRYVDKKWKIGSKKNILCKMLNEHKGGSRTLLKGCLRYRNFWKRGEFKVIIYSFFSKILHKKKYFQQNALQPVKTQPWIHHCYAWLI